MSIKRYSPQPLQPPLPLDQVAVIPLDVAGFCQPAAQVRVVDLVSRRVPSLGGFEAALDLQLEFIEALPAPEQETDASFEFAVPDNRVAIQKPYGMGVPDLPLSLGQLSVDDGGQQVADGLVVGELAVVVCCDVGMHNLCKS